MSKQLFFKHHNKADPDHSNGLEGEDTKGGGQGEQNPRVFPFQFSQESMSYLRALKSSITVTQLLQEVRATPTHLDGKKTFKLRFYAGCHKDNNWLFVHHKNFNCTMFFDWF